MEKYLNKYTKLIFISIALCLSGCDGGGEQLYNCNSFSVMNGTSFDIEIKENAIYVSFNGGPKYENEYFKYPDGSLRKPKIVSSVDAFEVEKEIKVPGDYPKVKAICRKFGPGVIVVN